MFNKDLRTVLKSLTQITDKFVLQYPKTTFTDEFQQLACALNLEALDKDFKGVEPIGINDAPNFLSAVELIDDAKITIKNRIISISNNYSSIQYLTADMKSMTAPSYEIIESTKKVDSILTFTITKDTIDQLRKAQQVFKDTNVVFIEHNNGKLTLTLGLDETFNALNNSFSTEIKDFNSTADFKIKVPTNSLLRVPGMDYKFEVKYSKKNDSYRVLLSNSILEVLMSIII